MENLLIDIPNGYTLAHNKKRLPKKGEYYLDSIDETRVIQCKKGNNTPHIIVKPIDKQGTTMTPDEIIEVIQAYKEGKQIQYTSSKHYHQLWEDTTHPTWDFSEFNYRIKPKPRTYYVNVHPDGIIQHYLHSSRKVAREDTLNTSYKTIKLIEVIEE